MACTLPNATAVLLNLIFPVEINVKSVVGVIVLIVPPLILTFGVRMFPPTVNVSVGLALATPITLLVKFKYSKEVLFELSCMSVP